MKTVFLSATGTDVGKTHFAEALLRADATDDRARRIVVWKPYESGIQPGVASDSERLAEAVRVRQARLVHETCRSEPPLGRFAQPLAPPLAAKLSGQDIKTAAFEVALARLRSECDVLVVELVGGLFAPLTDTWLCVDAARSVPDCSVVLVAPNRLGVIHDVVATVRAAIGVHVEHVVLSAGAEPDQASAHNEDVLRALVPAQLHSLARGPVEELAQSRPLRALAALLL